MAALVVRSSDEKSLLSSIFQPEKISATRSTGSGSSSRATRKSKNGPKKQPQRGLGVAQLEKLRIQEESKQDAACLASLGLVHLPTAYDNILARQIKGASFQIFRSPSSDRNGGNGGFFQLPAPDFHPEIFKGVASPAAGASSSSPPPPPSSHQAFALEKNPGVGIFMAMRGGSPPSREMIIKQEMKLGSGKPPGESLLGINCVQLVDSPLPPGPLPVPRDCRELPLVGVPKELSSFQTKFTGANHVWQPMHPASKQLVLQENPRVLISLDHPGEVHTQNSETTTEEHPLKATAHYTPRTISNALCTTFLKPEVPSNSNNNNSNIINKQADISTEGFGGSRKRGRSPYSEHSSSPSPPMKKAAATLGCGSTTSDFLALSLSIFHSDNTPAAAILQAGSGNDSGCPLQRSLSSLQEASSSGLSSEEVVMGGYGGGAVVAGNLGGSSSNSSCCSSSFNKSEVAVDLSLKLAI